MLLSEFDYQLPEELIAQRPSDKRENSKMLVLNPSEHKILHKHFYDIVDLIDDNSILILNNTKVIPARLYGYKDTGAKIEVFLLKEKDNHNWEVLIKPSKRVKVGTIVKISDELSCEVLESLPDDGKWLCTIVGLVMLVQLALSVALIVFAILSLFSIKDNHLLCLNESSKSTYSSS